MLSVAMVLNARCCEDICRTQLERGLHVVFDVVCSLALIVREGVMLQQAECR